MSTWVSSALFQVLVVMEDSVHALSKLAAAARRRLSPPPATAPGAPVAAVDGHGGGALPGDPIGHARGPMPQIEDALASAQPEKLCTRDGLI